MLSEEKRIELQNNIRNFYSSKKGEKILKKDNKKLLKDFKKKRGWFSPEENKLYEKMYKDMKKFQKIPLNI